MLPQNVIDLLRCPDTGERLAASVGALVSPSGRSFPVLADNFVELLPEKPAMLKGSCPWIDASDFYRKQLGARVDLSKREAGAWGVLETLPRGHRNFIKFELEKIEKLAESTRKRVLIDISGGCGTFTFALAEKFDLVVHFDLWDRSMNYAWHRAREIGIKNVVFVRGDFFRLPFAPGVADLVISTDTFIYYAKEDDLAVLKGCRKLLAPGGALFADFHNRKPFFGNPKIHEYSRGEMRFLEDGLPGAQVSGFCGVPATFLVGPLARTLCERGPLPPVRWILTDKNRTPCAK